MLEVAGNGALRDGVEFLLGIGTVQPRCIGLRVDGDVRH